MNIPSSITVHIIYKGTKLREITGVSTEDAVLSAQFVFPLFLREIFMSHPDIETEFPPGALGLFLNGKPPNEFDELHDGDVVTLIGADNGPQSS